MEKYKVLDHTADIMIEAYGKTLGELFENAAIGMCEQVVEKKVFPEATSYDTWSIALSGDLENELRDFLNWIKDKLYGIEIENMYPIKFEWSCGHVGVEFNLLDREKTIFCDEIKAVTFHEMLIQRYGIPGPAPGSTIAGWYWVTKIVFDV